MELQAENPYQAPRAPLDSVPAGPSRTVPLLYAPATWKFLLLSFGTLGLYLIIWFYRNWVALRRARQVDLWPVPRAIFSGITAYFCFEQMEDLLAKRMGRRAPQLNGGLMAFLYFILCVTSRLPHPIWMISLLAPLPVLWVNLRVRAAHLASSEEICADDPLSWGAWILVAFGFLFCALALVGLLLPDPG